MLTPQTRQPSMKPQQMALEDPVMKKLYMTLTDMESRPNVMTLALFRKFEPLFKKNSNISDEKIKELTKEFQSYVDFYKETQIVKSAADQTVIITLPSIFTPVRALSATERNASLVSANRAASSTNIPRYQAEAFANMFNALLSEQNNNTDTVNEYKERFVTVVNELLSKYSTGTTEPLKEKEEDIPVDTSTAWNLE